MAERDLDRQIIYCQKIWNSNADVSDMMIPQPKYLPTDSIPLEY